MPSERQIGITGEREPDLCAVTGRDVRGKHAVTHYGPNGQYVYVLAQVDHLWPQAAPAYGFPVHDKKPAQAEDVFVLPTSEYSTTITTPNISADKVIEYLDKTGHLNTGTSARPRAPKASSTSQLDITADGMSKESD